MITVEEASKAILATLLQPATEHVGLHDAVGRVLVGQVLADRDLPPFDRVAMDGIAIKHAEWASGVREYSILATQYAGTPAFEGNAPHSCIEIMTGAVLPGQFDTVVRYEDVHIDSVSNKAHIKVESITKGQNIQPKGKEGKQGQPLLMPNALIAPAEVAILASVGQHSVAVKKLPKVAIIATGDELVGTETTPLPHQIRMSNTYALGAALQRWKVPYSIFHLSDDKHQLGGKLEGILSAHDVVLMSGGVSAGKADHVPEVLADLGVTRHFHRIAQKPGKPFWYGSQGADKFVFAFPGNPVSTFLCYHRYFEPWLMDSLGLPRKQHFAMLASDFSFAPPLTYFLQVQLYQEGASVMAQPVAGTGSGDFANLTKATAFLELPAEKAHFQKGEVFPCWRFG